MSKQFIQIGCDIINVNDIIRVEIDCEYVVMYIRQIEAGEAEIVSGSYSKRLCWSMKSQAGPALLAWMKDRTEVLVPCTLLVEPAQQEPDLVELPY